MAPGHDTTARRRGCDSVATLPTMSRLRSLLVLAWVGSPVTTCLLWSMVALLCYAQVGTPLPISVDYPQHLALGTTLAQLLRGEAAARSLYEANLLTYYGLFHALLALLAQWLRPETAGKVLLVLTQLLWVGACLAVMRAARRPAWFVLLLVPFGYGFAGLWGLVNLSLGLPLAIISYLLWRRWAFGRTVPWWVVALAALLVGFAHVLAAAALGLSVGMSLLALMPPTGSSWRRWLGEARLRLAPLLPMLAWCAAAQLAQQLRPGVSLQWADAGVDAPAWYKLVRFGRYSVELVPLPSTDVLVWLLVAIPVGLYLWRFVSRSADRPARRHFGALALGWFAVYLLLPERLNGLAYAFERVAPLTALFVMAACPRPRAAADSLLRWLATLAVGALVLQAVALSRTVVEPQRAALEVIEQLPRDSNLLGLNYQEDQSPYTAPVWSHLAAMAQVRRSAVLAHSFIRYPYMPVGYRAGTQPPTVDFDERQAHRYQPEAPQSSFFPFLLLHLPAGYQGDPRALPFGSNLAGVRLVARRGDFALLDARQRFSPAAALDRP
jgi:hypothetical protein